LPAPTNDWFPEDDRLYQPISAIPPPGQDTRTADDGPMPFDNVTPQAPRKQRMFQRLIEAKQNIKPFKVQIREELPELKPENAELGTWMDMTEIKITTQVAGIKEC
jgi:hypothetical protein